MTKDILVISFIFFIAAPCFGGIGLAQNISNVMDFGAVGDGLTDDSQAFLKAWENVCGAPEVIGDIPTLLVPENKTFLLQPVRFQGPCQSCSVHFQISGIIVPPNSIDAWKDCGSDCWLCFSDVENLIIDGFGLIDGFGYVWWVRQVENLDNTQEANENLCNKPTAMHFHNCNNLQLSGLTHINSQKNHISINNCTGVSISNIQIIAPEDSPNTDGIDISKSSLVDIFNSSIATGDDCVAINGGSSFINIANVICGPGHGISVGSLGLNGVNDTVEEVHVKNCTFNGTQNGARIKTWPGGAGYARMISFEQITVIESKNPIIIDQYYQNIVGLNTIDNETAVAVSNVTYREFQGTSASELAIKLDCSNVIGCTNIFMDQINITSFDPSVGVFASCNNAHGIVSSSSLNVSCLTL